MSNSHLRFADLKGRLSDNKDLRLTEAEFVETFPDIDYVSDDPLYGDHPFTIFEKKVYVMQKDRKNIQVRLLACFEKSDGTVLDHSSK